MAVRKIRYTPETVHHMGVALINCMRGSQNNAVINEAYRLYQAMVERSKELKHETK